MKHDINGQKLFVRDEGEGPALLFLHGFLMDGRMFDAQVEHLKDDYRCIVVDTRGFGRSEWDGEPFTLYDVVDDCVALLDELGEESAVWCGMSQGGYAALRAALTHADRVRAMVLMSTTGKVDEQGTKDQYRDTAELWKGGPPQPLVDGLATALLGPREEVEDWWEVWLPRWRDMSAEAIGAGLNALIDRDDIVSRLGEIEQPALVAHGTRDDGMPIDHGEFLDEKLPNSKGLVRLEGGAHVAAMTHAGPLNAAIEAFLGEI
jgi:pimeloyl-ACP methyl ester carboxylesterase